MPITINNIASMSAARHLNAAQAVVMQAMERLASGKRINSAKDDPAGFSIANRMTSQINGMTQSIRNARDGISLAQVAEGALTTTEDVLQRIRVLAVQSSNATNSPADRQAMQQEADQLIAELNRQAESLSFNGIKIFDGTCGIMQFQVGANAGETIGMSGSNMLTRNYGNYRLFQPPAAIGPASCVTGGEISVYGSWGNATYTARAGASAKEIANGINNMSAKTGVTASAKTDTNLQLSNGTAYSFELTADNGKTTSFSFSTGKTGNAADDLAAAINAINAQAGKTGVTAQRDTVNGGIRLTHAQGADLTLTNTTDAASIAMSNYGADGKPQGAATLGSGESGVAVGAITYDSPYSFTITDNSGLKSDGGSSSAGKLHAVSSIDLTSFDNAQQAISIIDSALSTLNRERSRYGAMQSRFGYVIDSLSINIENTSAARSRIEDADYAAETARLTQSSILMQAATAMIAQANQMNRDLILSLLQSTNTRKR